MILNTRRAKYLITLAALMLVTTLGGCSSPSNLKTQPAQVITPVNDKFDYETGHCRIDGVYAEYATLDRGDSIAIFDEDDEFYYFTKDHLVQAIKKGWVRTEKEETFETYDGFTTDGAKVYGDYGLSEKVKSFKMNDNVRVVDKVKGVLLIEDEDQLFYMASGSVSKTRIVIQPKKKVYTAPAASSNNTWEETPSWSNSGGGGSGGSGGGGSAPAPAPAPAPTPSSGDGEDISLAFYGESSVRLLSDENTYEGIVLLDDITTYLKAFNRDDVIKVLNEDEEYCEILVEGFKARIARKYVRMDSEEAYEPWTGYTRDGVRIYSDYEKNEKIASFELNENVEIIDEFGSTLIVRMEDGTVGYMRSSDVAENKIVIQPKKKVYTAPAASSNNTWEETPSWSNSGGGGSGGSGGGGSASDPAPAPAPAPEPAPEWTDPVL